VPHIQQELSVFGRQWHAQSCLKASDFRSFDGRTSVLVLVRPEDFAVGVSPSQIRQLFA
jgi:hypothetical protein